MNAAPVTSLRRKPAKRTWPDMTVEPRYTWRSNSTLQCDREALALTRKLIEQRSVAVCGTNEFSALCHIAAVLDQRVKQGEQSNGAQA